MKIGKKLSLSSILSIIGAICFASVIVAAVLVTSNTVTFGGTTVTQASITLADSGSDTTACLAGNNAVYNFNADVQNAITSSGQVEVRIAKAGIALTDVTSASLNYDGLGASALTLSDAGEYLVGTYSLVGGTQIVDNTIPCVVTVVYATAGTYVVSVTMRGNA